MTVSAQVYPNKIGVEESGLPLHLGEADQPTDIAPGLRQGRRRNRDTFRGYIGSGITWLRDLARGVSGALLVEVGEGEGRSDLQHLRPQRIHDAAVPLVDLIDQIPMVPAATAVLGLSETGEAVSLNVTDQNTPHILIEGGSSAGKTSLLRTTAVVLALHNRQAGMQFVAACPISRERERQERHEATWKPLNYLPHMLCDVAFRQSEIRELLLFLVGELDYREKHSFGEPRIVVFIDQVDAVMERGGGEAIEAIHRLAQKGEEVGIHLVMSTDSTAPSAGFGPQLLSALPARVSGRAENKGSSSAYRSQQDPQPDKLLGGGDFVADIGGRRSHFQAAFVDDSDLHLALSMLYQPRKRLLAQPWSSRVRLHEASKAAGSLTYVNIGSGMLAAD